MDDTPEDILDIKFLLSNRANKFAKQSVSLGELHQYTMHNELQFWTNDRGLVVYGMDNNIARESRILQRNESRLEWIRVAIDMESEEAWAYLQSISNNK